MRIVAIDWREMSVGRGSPKPVLRLTEGLPVVGELVPILPQYTLDVHHAVWSHFGQRDELMEPKLRYDRIVVEQDELHSPRFLQPLVDRYGKPDFLSVGDQGNRHARGILYTSRISGRVVD